MANPYHDSAIRAATEAGVDPNLFAALIRKESGWDPSAVSPKGASGLTQVMPDTARDPGFGIKPLANPGDPDEQLRFGAQYLKAMLDRYGGDVDRALAAYNWGPGNADNWSGSAEDLPDETRGYISDITNEDYSRLAGIINNSADSPNGQTGSRIADNMRENAETEKKQSRNYGGLVAAGLQAMETGNMASLGSAFAGMPRGGPGLMEDARTNWANNKQTLSNIGSTVGGWFGGGAG